MMIIYEPKGKAREYSPLACNLFTGCSHACKYCYCPTIRRQSLEEWATNPKPRKNILRSFEKEAAAMAGDPREILFCFMSDPYQSHEAAEYTRKALRICERYNLRAQVLTKNPEAALADLHMFQENGWKLGSTIIFSRDTSREEWEPGAPSIQSRCEAVRDFHEAGVYTWISVEPVIYPEQALRVIDRLRPYVDFWKVGRWNHDRRADKIDWATFLHDAERLLAGHDYYIKKDLEKHRA